MLKILNEMFFTVALLRLNIIQFYLECISVFEPNLLTKSALQNLVVLDPKNLNPIMIMSYTYKMCLTKEFCTFQK